MTEVDYASTGSVLFRVGILGAGMIATAGYGVLPNLYRVADPVVERAKHAAAEFRIENVYASLDEMLNGAEIDAVVNLTPIPDHAATSLKIDERGKHLASEKPLAATTQEANVIIDTASRNNVIVVCSPPDALYGQYVEARRLLDADAAGKVAFARVQSSHAGRAVVPRHLHR